jgi:hypothetical protein
MLHPTWGGRKSFYPGNTLPPKSWMQMTGVYGETGLDGRPVFCYLDRYLIK